MNGINAPEKGQPFGNNATRYLSQPIGGKFVRLTTYETDRYDRTIADVYLPVDDANNPAGVVMPDTFINRELVKPARSRTHLVAPFRKLTGLPGFLAKDRILTLNDDCNVH